MATQTTSDPSVEQAPLRLRFDSFELDEADARLTREGQPIPIAPRPFAVLCALARSPRMLVTKNVLLDSVWGHRFVSDSVLKTTVSAFARSAGRQPETAAIHRNRVAARLSFHRGDRKSCANREQPRTEESRRDSGIASEHCFGCSNVRLLSCLRCFVQGAVCTAKH
jgi:hypothetical protein